MKKWTSLAAALLLGTVVLAGAPADAKDYSNMGISEEVCLSAADNPERVDKNTLDDLFESAGQGYTKAQYALGVIYLYGNEYVSKDVGKAVKWLTKAADDGERRAQTMLGELYLDGDEVRKDYYKAGVYLEKAAAKGHAHSQFLIGMMYASGMGRKADEETAKFWLNCAAQRGDSDAEEYLRSHPKLGE